MGHVKNPSKFQVGTLKSAFHNEAISIIFVPDVSWILLIAKKSHPFFQFLIFFIPNKFFSRICLIQVESVVQNRSITGKIDRDRSITDKTVRDTSVTDLSQLAFATCLLQTYNVLILCS